MKERLALLSALLGNALSLSAQVHVAPTGNDAAAGTQSSPFRTIDHAAAVAAPGSTIFLHAGTYGDEQGIVQLGTKDLVLQGAGAASTVLRPHLSAVLALPAAEPSGGAPITHRVGMLLSGTAKIHLRDLTIDAQRLVPPAGQLVGLYLRGGVDVVLDHVTIVDCRPTTLGGNLAQAIAVRGDVPTDPTTLVVRDGTFTQFGAAAVRAFQRAEVDLVECSIAGAYGETPAADQVGVWLEAGAIGSVRLARLAGFAGSAGAAVRLDGHGSGCVVEANRIARAAFGVDVRHAPSAIVPGSLRDNRIAALDLAVRVRGVSGLLVADNGLFAASRFDGAACTDDTAAGNAWQGNRYAVAPTTTSVAIPGGSNVDATPRAGVSELRELDRVACGGAPAAVVVADFDADGRDDFATLDFRDAGVGLSVGRWRVGGHLVAALPFGTPGLQPVGLVAGDFDGAPGVDLVALTAPLPPLVTGAAFWVFHNDGAGGMSLLHHEPLPGFVNPAALATASFNQNPFGDLVVVDQGTLPFTPGRAVTFLNDGTGAVWFATPLPAVFTEAAVAASTGDLDGDHKVDLAIAEGSPSSGRVHWFRGNGIGFFNPAIGSPLACAVNPRGVAIADFDADGDRDLLVAATGAPLPLQRGVLQVFANELGMLVAQPLQPTDLGPTRLVATDLDADDFLGVVRPELLVLDLAAGAVSLFGAYERTTGFVGGGLSTLAEAPVDLASTDVDGDDFPDVVVAEPMRGGVAFLRGSPTALVATFGRGCPGTAGREPRLETRGAPGLPTQPNASLQIGLVDAAPLSLGVYALTLLPAPVLMPCNLLLTGADVTWIVITDVNGRAAIVLPLPGLPDFRGLPMCFQAGVLDPAATTSVFPGFSLTAGLRVRIGD